MITLIALIIGNFLYQLVFATTPDIAKAVEWSFVQSMTVLAIWANSKINA